MSLLIMLNLCFISLDTCPQLPLSPHLSISSTEVSIGTVVKFNCETGWHLTGVSSITCLSDGTWDNAVPQCDQGGKLEQLKSFSIEIPIYYSIHFILLGSWVT